MGFVFKPITHLGSYAWDEWNLFGVSDNKLGLSLVSVNGCPFGPLSKEPVL